MHRHRRLLVLAGVVLVALVSVIFFTGIFVNFQDPAFQRALLRLLALLGLGSMLAMCGTLLMRAETIDHLAQPAVDTHRPRARR